ncbi:WPP domain-associated protein-like isoform X2 [Olea europaea var. sylvestris]|uniref:WPP domain-associated protein-like isoform X2 n=1 Tax=Olea europaea var. sylvestris TaxID=158386 RepID=UPI000C1D1835|nr:WPP domain-associated protein-like isoform X2 [Olea europaea var. sylvestris]XP_022879372.1 WPP domain-associated protein-like isoform X2 [Olea europaea var. sylvestris]XP_022879373.1 WPP domain-associated protein-like isoform X2 [Olea europaea var. sylvestris]
MGSQELLRHVGKLNGDAITLCGIGLEQLGSENGSEPVDGEGLTDLMVTGDRLGEVNIREKEKANLADKVLENLEDYWEDMSDRLMISRMVSDSVIKGMVNAVEQEAAEKIAAKDLEVAKLKERFLSFNLEPHVMPSNLENGNCRRCLILSDAYMNGDSIREFFCGLRNEAREQFEKVKKEIDGVRGCNNIKRIGSGSQLVCLGEILHEKQSESWLRVDRTLDHLKNTVDTMCTRVDDMLQLSKKSLVEWKQERHIQGEIEDMVMQSVIRNLQEEFEEKLMEQNAQFCGSPIMNLLEKFDDISSLRNKLDSILNLLSHPEMELISHGSHDMDHIHRKGLSNHVKLPTTLLEGNGKLEASKTDAPENFEHAQLKHLSKEELVNYFNDTITKMKRDHESALVQKTEEYFTLRREHLKQKSFFMSYRKDEEFDVLRKKIPEIISKLDDVHLETEKFSALTNNADCLVNLKDRLNILLCENRQLRDALTDKKNEVKCLEAQVSDAARKILQHSTAEEDMLKLLGNLNSATEDTCIEALLTEEVYKCVLKELDGQMRRVTEDSNMEFLITMEVYEILLSGAAVPAETTSGYEIKDSDIESLIMVGLCRLLFREATRDTQGKIKELYQEYLIENEKRISLESKSLEKENELKLEVQEKEILKKELLKLEKSLEENKKFATELSTALTKENELFGLASQELNRLREHASWQESLVTESSKELELVKGQLQEALERIKEDDLKINVLNQKLEQSMEEMKEANEKQKLAVDLARERHETQAKELIKQMDLVTKMLDDFGIRISESIKNNKSRLEDAQSDLRSLTEVANELRRTGQMYKLRFERRCADLQMAEAEVDLLADEVDALLSLLNKIYIALDHYSPVLQHYPGIIEILKLVRRELTGEATKTN